MIRMIKYVSLCFLGLYLVGCSSVERLAIPKASLLNPILEQSGEKNYINHKSWDHFLDVYTIKDKQGVVRVDYANVLEKDHQQLKEYIQKLSEIDTASLSRNAQLAYWANLYNALTVDVILDHYPVKSIRDIKGGFFDLGPWEDKRLNIGGKQLSLHDIEHRIIRALWSDTPEVHYILNCAAAGCPNLSQTSFEADNVQQIMKQAAIDYVNNPRGVVVFDDRSIALSKIYSWYIDDFGGSEQEILNHLILYAHEDLQQKLLERPIVRQYFYDWALNDRELSNSFTAPVLNERILNE